MKEAFLYKLKEDYVECLLCNHFCKIPPGKRGICGVRENRKGVLYTLSYGWIIASHVDPIEKKPLYHFLPGSLAFSIATVGCNFKCSFCQNWEISQYPAFADDIPGNLYTPEDIVEIALNRKCESISYTYTEPTIFFEFAYETAKLASSKGLKNTFVTNGYMSKEAIDMIVPYLDGANVDLKSYNPEFYKKYCKATLQPVLDNIKYLKEKGIWVEVTTLLITGLNDSEEEIRQIAEFLYAVDPSIPWHVSRFYPCYQMLDRKSTPYRNIINAREIGLKVGLKYVYTGNIVDEEGSVTYCPSCGKILIKRAGFFVARSELEEGQCPECGKPIAGIWC